ncbi:DUF4150 domain-containing protein [bacterium]|nr:MAG: DUF4150 domain-containing protein [bacterium]
MNFGFPDVCKTIIGPAIVPLPYPNIAISVTHIPSQFKVIIGGGLAENLLTSGTVSNGDEAGLAMGLISQIDVGPDRPFLGSFKVMIGGIFSTRLTSIQGQNGIPCNTIGISITPSQIRVMALT